LRCIATFGNTFGGTVSAVLRIWNSYSRRNEDGVPSRDEAAAGRAAMSADYIRMVGFAARMSYNGGMLVATAQTRISVVVVQVRRRLLDSRTEVVPVFQGSGM
jgi:hypothetical protein